jgi:DNA topoisomerase-1
MATAELYTDVYASSARAAGLRYVTDATPGISRQRRGQGFTYFGPNGVAMRDRETLQRIRSLVIPPAWTHVWICPHANGHLQVTARDARGRKQYRYHPEFRAQRDQAKFDRMFAFSEVLWKIRERVEHDIALPGLPREKVMATMVALLERTLIRVGSDEYAKANKSYGLTTLRRKHVVVRGDALRFEFRGKSGVVANVGVTDRRIARVVQRCQELPGQELFKYLDDEGTRRSVDAADINDYLREITDREITAKDFRTFSGTMLAADSLRRMGPAGSQRQANQNIVKAIDETAARLGNTRAVCRKYYIHPVLMEAYLAGEVLPPPAEGAERVERRSAQARLRRHEEEVLAFLRARLHEDDAKGAKKRIA